MTETICFKRERTWLKSANVRATKQRLLLAKLLVGDGKHRHVCAETLFEAAKMQTSISLATVYNTLKLFSDAGLLNEITVNGHKSYFDTRIDQHWHYYWQDLAILTDAPQGIVSLNYNGTPPAGSKLVRIDVIIRLKS